jgi:ferri-bacillibactin esterase
MCASIDPTAARQQIIETARPVVIARAMQFDLVSKVNRRRYSIRVAQPLADSPGRPCPVFYVLDGDWYFGSAVEAVRSNAPHAVVVGIGYPDDEGFVKRVVERRYPLPAWLKDVPPAVAAASLERMYDLSLPASDEVLASDFPRSSRISGSEVGGLDAFLEVLETEIKPRVGAIAPIDSSNQAIFGHSLGGLAVLHSLFVEPSAFRTFVAASPSIWWNEKSVLSGETRFAEAVRAGNASPRLLVTMGSEEERADPELAAKCEMDLPEYEALVRKHRMVENARELTERLKGLSGSGHFTVEEYAVFPKQDHWNSLWPALGRAVSFAFPP